MTGDPQSAQAVGAALLRVEPVIRDPRSTSAQLKSAGEIQQDAYGAMASHPEWAPLVAAMVPTTLRPAVLANATAATELAALARGGAPLTTVPAWRIVDPAPAETLLSYYHEAEASTGVPWSILAAIHFIETRLGRVRGNSGAGAQGPMQFLPSTWESYGAGGDIGSDHDSIQAAGRFLGAHGGRAHLDSAVFAYNRSEHYVRAVRAYASVMDADARAFYGYYRWQVQVGVNGMTMVLPAGFVGPGA